MHDNDADGRRMLADVTRLVELIGAVDAATTPQQKAAALRALRVEARRQAAESMERTRRRYRDWLTLNGILRASGQAPGQKDCGSASV